VRQAHVLGEVRLRQAGALAQDLEAAGDSMVGSGGHAGTISLQLVICKMHGSGRTSGA
jgi:hypothetical protein